MLDVGSKLGPYAITARIGAGGMGEVWRARDERLHRDVAIKVLPPAMMESEVARVRFEREARAVAALSHPNVLAIHDFGSEDETVYAVMELLEGSTLRARLAQAELTQARALEWAHQIAQGLAAAHERGIIHRDLKPENIFITRDGVVKILDFGLARLHEPGFMEGGDGSTLVAKTNPGTIIGTLAYLSPEQARGETADQRSDIFAFGAVFYEMLGGAPAFLRKTPADMVVAILREEPRPLSESGRNISIEAEDILRHCLEKSPEDRFRSARDLAFALRLAMRSSSSSSSDPGSRHTPRPSDSGARPGEISIAVLPFRNIGASVEGEYFGDGMTEEIINSISNIPSLRVAARTSSFAFKGRDDDVRRIGRELGVAMVLEGSIRQLGSRLRVSAQLINVDSGYQVWSERWDRDLADVFAVQDEIAQAIAATFKVRLVQGESGATAGKTQNVEAYDRLLKGRWFLARRRTGDAIAEIEAAIESDHEFADAHVTLADAWAMRGFYGGVPSWEAWARGRAALDEAERIAPESAGIPLSKAIFEHYYGWNTDREQAYCREAIERNPKSADGWNWLGLCLGVLGRTSESRECTARGIELEPHNANVRASRAWASLFVGDYETASRELARAIEIDPNSAFALWTQGTTLRCLGRFEESIAMLDALVTRSERKVPLYLALLGASLAASGARASAEAIREELGSRAYVPSLDLATLHTALGDHDAALDALERARDERNALLWARLYFPDYLSLRDEPRWKGLAARLGRTAPVTL